MSKDQPESEFSPLNLTEDSAAVELRSQGSEQSENDDITTELSATPKAPASVFQVEGAAKTPGISFNTTCSILGLWTACKRYYLKHTEEQIPSSDMETTRQSLLTCMRFAIRKWDTILSPKEILMSRTPASEERRLI